MKNETEVLFYAAQGKAIRTIYLKHHIEKTSKSPLCRLCGEKVETVQHLVKGFEKLAQKKYKRRRNNLANKVHSNICHKNGLEHTEKWYENVPQRAVKNKEVKVFWDIIVPCDNIIEARRPDIIVIDKKEWKGIIINIVVSADIRIEEKEREEAEKNQNFKWEIGRFETQYGRSSACSDRSPSKCHKRFWEVD